MTTVLRLEQILIAVAVLTLLATGVERFRRGLRVSAPGRGPLAVLGGLALAALLVRLLTPSAFLHVGFHPYGLLDAVLGFPAVSTYRASYGQGSFFVLGAVEALVGGGWKTVLVTNALAGTFILVACAALANRLGGWRAAAATLALGLVSPLLVKVAASEDAHNVAVLFGTLALLSAATLRRDATWTARRLAVPAAWLLVALGSRQTMFLHYPLVLLLLWPPRGAPRSARRNVIVLAALLLVPLALRAIVVLGDGSQDGATIEMLVAAVRVMATSKAGWLRNPMLQPTEGLALALAALIGGSRVLRAPSRLGVVLVAGAVAHFLATFCITMSPGPGVQYMLRVPFWALLLPLGGLGLAHLADLIAGPATSRARRIAVPAVLVGLAAAAPLPRFVAMLETVDPKIQEYRVISDHRASIEPGATIVFPRLDVDGQTNYRIPYGAFGEGPFRVVYADDADLPPGPRYLFDGLGCYAYGFLEMVSESRARAWSIAVGSSAEELDALVQLLWDDPEGAVERFHGTIPTEPRPECREILRDAGPLIPWGTVHVERQEVPQAYFIRRDIPIGLRRIYTDRPAK